jgi:hypothetical protein
MERNGTFYQGNCRCSFTDGGYGISGTLKKQLRLWNFHLLFPIPIVYNEIREARIITIGLLYRACNG